MAKSTAIMEMRRHDPTNPHWAQFGEAQGEWKRILQSLNPVAKMHRKRWMHQVAYTPMPTGPYPVYVVGCGWSKFYVDSKDYQICYCPRGDLNLDVNVFQLIYDQKGQIEARRPVTNDKLNVPCIMVQEEYDVPTGRFLEVNVDRNFSIIWENNPIQ